MHSNTLRRRHSTELKQQVLTACAQPDASIAAVARAFGLNANLVHKWRRGREAGPVASAASTAVAESAPQFIALSLSLPSPPPTSAPAPALEVAAVVAEAIRLEFKRGALGMSVTWPVSAAADCAAWLREVLR
ncbi:transposase [Variovorax sp. RTB1]|uniref:IS66-like element accessory protein TnpA n=1 Tax=Variovorax sp. RTB1 TaxID=3048631 RepID=UPI002B2224E6|nr:transposase [Variovorax sp. RTB1]MEB0113695.1 transposase [Variovorax sp. RTB1]